MGDAQFGYGLHHVQLAIPAGGEEECRAFYVGVPGMAEVAKPPALAGNRLEFIQPAPIE